MLEASLVFPYEPYFKVAVPTQERWRALQVYHIYRILVALVVLMGYALGVNAFSVDCRLPTAFVTLAASYLLFAVSISYFGLNQRTYFNRMVMFEAFADSFWLSALVFAGTGVQSGMGIFLNVAIAAFSILLPGLIAVFFASIATISLIGQHLYVVLAGVDPIDSPFIIGLHGVSFFATAITGFMLAKRLQRSETLATKQQTSLENLSMLNETIIEHMEAGIVVVDSRSRVRLMNQAAYGWLGLTGNLVKSSLEKISPALAEQLALWINNPSEKLEPLTLAINGPTLSLQVSTIGTKEAREILIVLEDLSRVAQQAQQLKLASLGRFTASIAHELRNPLGAISHAVQLLLEELPEKSPEHRLGTIIHAQSQRMNQVIKNILQLSRQKPAVMETIWLRPWLDQFVHDYHQTRQTPIQLLSSPEMEDLKVNFDPHQLQQVLTIIFDNSEHHAQSSSKALELTIQIGFDSTRRRAFLEVGDNGPGIPDDVLQHIFEPFYTTSRTGTGLGLYIANEVCLYNQSNLKYQSDRQGASFRIDFHKVREES